MSPAAVVTSPGIMGLCSERQPQPAKCGGAAGKASDESARVASERPGHAEPKTDTRKVQQSGGQREAHAEGECAGRAELAAMRVAVEEGEEADHDHGDGDRD